MNIGSSGFVCYWSSNPCSVNFSVRQFSVTSRASLPLALLAKSAWISMVISTLQSNHAHQVLHHWIRDFGGITAELHGSDMNRAFGAARLRVFTMHSRTDRMTRWKRTCISLFLD